MNKLLLIVLPLSIIALASTESRQESSASYRDFSQKTCPSTDELQHTYAEFIELCNAYGIDVVKIARQNETSESALREIEQLTYLR